MSTNIAKHILMEQTILSIVSDVKELIAIVCDHGKDLRELFLTANSAATKAELYAAISSIRVQNLQGNPPSNTLKDVMGENQKFSGFITEVPAQGEKPVLGKLFLEQE